MNVLTPAARRAPRSLRGMGDASPYSPVVSFQPVKVGNPLARQGTPLQVGDTFAVSISGGAPNTEVSVDGTHNGVLDHNTMGHTDANGNWAIQGSFDASTVGNWSETWYVGTQNAGSFQFAISQPSAPASQTYMPSVTFTPSRPGTQFQIGDTWRISISGGAPNAPVTVTGVHDGVPATNTMGNTDSSGHFVLDGTFTADVVGQWSQTWFVNGQTAGTFSFTVQSPTGPAPSGETQTGTTQQTSTSSFLANLSNTEMLLAGAGVLTLLLLAGGKR